MNAVYTISEFCAAHKISRAFYYKLSKEGRGPAEMRVGRRVLIREEAAAAWRADLEQQSATSKETLAPRR